MMGRKGGDGDKIRGTAPFAMPEGNLSNEKLGTSVNASPNLGRKTHDASLEREEWIQETTMET